MDLAAWFRKLPSSKFPGGKVYIARYDVITDFLAKEVHPLVATGAALKDGIFLTDHGPGHIETVIRRASDMIAAKECTIEPYEVYLLLAAIQMHDAGNILGRIGHEKLPDKLRERLEAQLGNESVEKRMILNIARAHGGTVEGNKDTIVALERQATILGRSVRPQLLAAVLRFADELADDRTRTARLAVSIGAVPEGSRIFHKYSEALHSVVVDTKGRAVNLLFDVSQTEAKIQFQKDGGQTYILDEIIARTLKMHRELVYCTRFMRPAIALDTISVKNTVYGSDPYAAPLEIPYRLEDRGYPDSKTIWEMCPDLKAWHNGAPLSGSTLAARLEESKKE